MKTTVLGQVTWGMSDVSVSGASPVSAELVTSAKVYPFVNTSGDVGCAVFQEYTQTLTVTVYLLNGATVPSPGMLFNASMKEGAFTGNIKSVRVLCKANDWRLYVIEAVAFNNLTPQ